MAFSIRPKLLDANKALDARRPLISSGAKDLLTGQLARLGLRRLEIECDFDIGTDNNADFECEVKKIFQRPKEEEVLLQLEAEDYRRRLLADTWTALGHNKSVRELSVDRFVPVWTSAFHSTDFRGLLERLESLHINIFGSKSGYRSVNTVPAYIDSLQSILKVLCLHSSELRRLSLHASQHAPLGARKNYHIPLSLKSTQLPKLRHLSLKNCFIGFELAHFINSHDLETLELRNCYSYRGTNDGDESGGMAWAPFMTAITRPGMRLRVFEVDDDYIPLTIDDKRLDSYDPNKADEPQDVKNIRRTQKRKPTLRLFLYAFLRDYSGELWMNKEAILASFDAEDDQLAYEALMKIVRQNCDGSRDGPASMSEKGLAIDPVKVIELSARDLD